MQMNAEDLLRAAKERRARMWGDKPNLVNRDLVRPPTRTPAKKAEAPSEARERQRAEFVLEPWMFSHLRGPERAKFFLAFFARKYGLEPREVLTGGRTTDVVCARQEAIYYTARHTRMSLPQIGAVFNRDHTTVHHAIRRMDATLGTTVLSDRLQGDEGSA